MAMNDRHKLLFSYPANTTESLPSLPTDIKRTFIHTPSGRLELLIAEPSSNAFPQPQSQPPRPALLHQRKKAIFFQHGGFGFAGCWIPFMRYFASLGYPCYALSLRGHGASWKPSYFRMVWMTGIRSMSEDLGHGLEYVRGLESQKRKEQKIEIEIDGENFEEAEQFEEEDLVLVGHSAGGGLVQYFLGQNKGRVGGAVIVAAFPCFGGYGVYWNWFKNDPWFAPRYYIRDFWHSRSPLSSTTLVHNAFFSPPYPRSQVREFEVQMCEYESMIWPLQMMVPFVNVTNVIKNILGWKSGKQRLLFVAGEIDTLMGVRLMQQMAEVYRAVVTRLLGKEDSSQDGSKSVGFEIISASGHHLQNDLNWEEAAVKIAAFIKLL